MYYVHKCFNGVNPPRNTRTRVQNGSVRAAGAVGDTIMVVMF